MASTTPPTGITSPPLPHNQDAPSFAPAPAATAPPSKIPITLTGVPETMLATLSARALDAAKPTPFLNDVYAAPILERLDYPIPTTMIKDMFMPVVLSRSKLFDEWTREFLGEYLGEGEEHGEGVTVLGLGCGLDSRHLRVVGDGVGGGGGREGKVRWIDVDMEEVIEVRRQVMPIPEGADYKMVGADVTGEGWLEEIPNDRPTLVICEGLLMYLEIDEVLKLMKRVCERFEKGGQIMGDVLGRKFIASQERLKTIARTGAKMVSAVDYGKELAVAHERLRVKDEVRMWQRAFKGLIPWHFRVFMRIYGLLPGYRTVSADLRLEF